MSLEIGTLTTVTPPASAWPAPRPVEGAGPVAPRRGVDTVEVDVPARPPSAVLDAVDRAADRAKELAAANYQLHFETDKDSGRVIIQVRDLDGNVLRTIPPSEALRIMDGASPA